MQLEAVDDFLARIVFMDSPVKQPFQFPRHQLFGDRQVVVVHLVVGHEILVDDMLHVVIDAVNRISAAVDGHEDGFALNALAMGVKAHTQMDVHVPFHGLLHIDVPVEGRHIAGHAVIAHRPPAQLVAGGDQIEKLFRFPANHGVFMTLQHQGGKTVVGGFRVGGEVIAPQLLINQRAQICVYGLLLAFKGNGDYSRGGMHHGAIEQKTHTGLKLQKPFQVLGDRGDVIVGGVELLINHQVLRLLIEPAGTTLGDIP